MSIKTLRRQLPIQHRSADGWCWRLQSSAIRKTSEESATYVVGDHERKKEFQLVKENRWRRTFLLCQEQKTYFIKYSRLRPKQQIQATLRWVNLFTGDYKGPLVECANTLLARELDLKAPDVYGFGEYRNGIGLVTKQIIIFEALTDKTKLRQALEEVGDDLDQKIVLLERASRLILELYRDNIVHLDLSISNVMLSAERAEEDSIVDLEPFLQMRAAGEKEKRTRLLLAFCYGYLYKVEVFKHVPEGVYDEFAFAQMNIALKGDLLPMRAQKAYDYFKRHNITHSKRILVAEYGFLSGLSIWLATSD